MNREMSSSPSTSSTTAAASAPAAGVKAAQKNAFLTNFVEIVNDYPGSVMQELLRLYPDGLLLGSGLFALLTQNFAYAMFFVIVLESLLVSVGLNKLFSFVDLARTKMTKDAISEPCRSGFQSPTADGLANLFQFGAVSGFPSTHMFVGSSSISYIIFSMQNLINELSVLGPEYSTRYYVGIIFAAILLFIIAFYRLQNNCEGVGTILVSLLLGVVFGYAFYLQNSTIFGRESINVLNIPLFKNRDINGKPIYICPTS